jgi:hypothetical protein
MFQDDIVVPLGDHKHVNILLNKMTKYGKKWDIIFAPQKFNVLAFGDNTKRSYQLGDTEKSTERKEKYLSIVLDTKSIYIYIKQKVLQEIYSLVSTANT